MKIRFENAAALMDGIILVAPDLGFEITESCADLTVTVAEVTERIVTVTLDGNRATVTYGDGSARFFRGLARLLGWIRDGITAKTETERPLFSKNGGMFSVSRGGVLRVETVKATMRAMALMGLNSYMLYSEDTFEIDGYPYFGRARGRYSKAELKEMDAYALCLGIELIPCIQVLGHLSNYLSQKQAYSHKDTESVLLVGSDETYALIDGMLSTVCECFTTKRVHIGMDETYDLGVGKYLDKFGYRERHTIFFEHLERVRKMAEARGLDPMMWSDMFFRLAGKGLKGYVDYDTRVQFTEKFRAEIPQGVRPIFWDYYNADTEFYRTNIEKHRFLFDREPIYAGGIWLWSGQGPLYSRSFDFTYPALDACRETGIKEVFATIWGGDDSHLVLALPGLAWFADYDYVGGYDEASMKRSLRDACGEDYDTLMLCELPEHPDGQKISLTRGLLYNDPLLGLADKHFEHLPMKDYYAQ
ncbi:MAG: family 20 glycosylhydrolase, partial [Clostridia bacterium]|nr:family 20 glycosylhydrolase [Clostridia bacterium]